MSAADPEIANRIAAGGIETNDHDAGRGPPVLFIHGSGPGVSAWANWRLAIPPLSRSYRVIAPDMAGFGFSDRPRASNTARRPGSRRRSAFWSARDREGACGRQLVWRRDRARARRPPARAGRAACPDGACRRSVPDHAGSRRGLGLRALVGVDAQAPRHLRLRPEPRERRTGGPALSRQHPPRLSRILRRDVPARRASAGSRRSASREADIRAIRTRR